MTAFSIEAAVAEVRRDVEIVLQTRFGLEHPEDKYRDYVSRQVRIWRGVLSTDPAQVNPDHYYLFAAFYRGDRGKTFSDCIRGECQPISRELGVCMLEAGLDVMQGFNGYPETSDLHPCHEYLVAPKKGQEILIDPTIAQMIQGHDHVFVGTRDQLREKVFRGIKPEGPFTRLRTPDLRDHTEEAFELNWGIKARTAPFRLNHFFFDVNKMKVVPLG